MSASKIAKKGLQSNLINVDAILELSRVQMKNLLLTAVLDASPETVSVLVKNFQFTSTDAKFILKLFVNGWHVDVIKHSNKMSVIWKNLDILVKEYQIPLEDFLQTAMDNGNTPAVTWIRKHGVNNQVPKIVRMSEQVRDILKKYIYFMP